MHKPYTCTMRKVWTFLCRLYRTSFRLSFILKLLPVSTGNACSTFCGGFASAVTPTYQRRYRQPRSYEALLHQLEVAGVSQRGCHRSVTGTESSGWNMSVVTVQLGQCGNQVGQELFDIICSDAQEGQRKTYSAASCERFFHQTAQGGTTPL